MKEFKEGLFIALSLILFFHLALKGFADIPALNQIPFIGKFSGLTGFYDLIFNPIKIALSNL